MALRDLTRSGNCTVSGSSLQLNPLASLADLILRSTSTKKELESLPGVGEISCKEPSLDSLPSLPGSEHDHSNKIVNDYQDEYGNIWSQSKYTQKPQQFYGMHTSHEVQSLHNHSWSAVQIQQGLEVQLPKNDIKRVRDRTNIISRHILADKRSEYIHAQVNPLLNSLNIKTDVTTGTPLGNCFSEPEYDWNEEYNRRVWISGNKRFVDNNDEWAIEFSLNQDISSQDLADKHGGLKTLAKGSCINEVPKLNITDSDEEDWLRYVVEGSEVNRGLLSSASEYPFVKENPYIGHPNLDKEAKKLFYRGLLNEAILALEAAVLENPKNGECWRLLGMAHAENEDDYKAITAMTEAYHADPTNLETVLSICVSYTNELKQEEALKYLRSWLLYHPYGRFFNNRIHGSNLAQLLCLFCEASQMYPDDADLKIATGVLFNLLGNFEQAITSFQNAIRLTPTNYALWNKLGATQTNSSRNADALRAYQKALDLKPNYVRAWSNMAICYANQGQYHESLRFYIRALCMNPKAENLWQYLEISLRLAARDDLLHACSNKDLELLQQEYPL